MKQIVFLIALCFCVSVVQTRAQKINLSRTVGVANSTSDGKICFAISNKTLKRGQRIGVIYADKPQNFRLATVESKTSKSCSSDNDISDGVSFYFLKMKPLDQPSVEIGVVGLTKTSKSKGYLRSDINDDKKLEYFRSCTSNEGVHLTVWRGVPLKSKRIWHAYYYLSYDTEPTCKRKDYAGT